MFSTSKRKPGGGGRNAGRRALVSPETPAAQNRGSLHRASIPDRPSTGTPAPWSSTLSTLDRCPDAGKSEQSGGKDELQPVYVGECPQTVRDELARVLWKHAPGEVAIYGGIDGRTCLSWITCRDKLLIWNYLSCSAGKDCVVLEIPSRVCSSWLLCVVGWDAASTDGNALGESCRSVSVVLCSKTTGDVLYWPDIYGEVASSSVGSSPLWDESEVGSLDLRIFNSLIASPTFSDTRHVCVALACSTTGELWAFHCSPDAVRCYKVFQDINGPDPHTKGYPRSLIWRSVSPSLDHPTEQFLLLSNHEIQCFTITIHDVLEVSKLWSHEIAAHGDYLHDWEDDSVYRQVWPLDMQVEENGKVIKVLIATNCDDGSTNLAHIQFSLLTLQQKAKLGASCNINGEMLEKMTPVQVIIPKANVEDEDFLFSLRLRVGGRPSGSVLMLTDEGLATVIHSFRRNTASLYQFDLPYDTGKVIDASVLCSTDDNEGSTWIVLTRNGGIWAIPEKSIVLEADASLQKDGGNVESKTDSIARFWTNQELLEFDDGRGNFMSAITARTAQDEESEALLGQLFNEFLVSGQVYGSLDKLQHAGAFDRDGEANVFACTSKSIVDTLSKHWTTTRGAEIVSMAILSSQLVDKQQKHERFLQFLALSKCHEELCSRNRNAMLGILEHGEKLAAMIELRELQNISTQNHPSAEHQISSVLWDLIQLVGERTRRKTVLLMDRENAEIFYSKVSDLEQVFCNLDRYFKFILSKEQEKEEKEKEDEQYLNVQIQRACEISNAVVSIIQTSMLYKTDHQMWYPPPEGLTPWYCHTIVRNGLWCVASFLLHITHEISGLDISLKSKLYTHLEVLADVLLETYDGAIASKLELGEEHVILMDEFVNRKDCLLGSLYEQVKDLAEGQHLALSASIHKPEQEDEILRKLSSNLLAIAKKHEGYDTMWSICCDLNDSVLLRKLMQDSVGPRGGFSSFVFKQVYEKGQFSRLLRFGEEFQQELSNFLTHHHSDLLWLHELFLHQFSLASETLHCLALSQHNGLNLNEEQEPDPKHANLRITSTDRKRLLNLSKIAAIAGKSIDCDAKIKRIDADIMLLRLQEEIVKFIVMTDETKCDGQELYSPEELIELCLGSGNHQELGLLAFDVFACTTSSFLLSHKNLLAKCWKKVADMDNWRELYEASMQQGWSDEETLCHLRHTALFLVSSRFYGTDADTIGEGGFEEVLPLRNMNREIVFPDGLDFSVEAVLMQHGDFPEAGKLMLTALMLPTVQFSAAEECALSPME